MESTRRRRKTQLAGRARPWPCLAVIRSSVIVTGHERSGRRSGPSPPLRALRQDQPREVRRRPAHRLRASSSIRCCDGSPAASPMAGSSSRSRCGTSASTATPTRCRRSSTRCCTCICTCSASRRGTTRCSKRRRGSSASASFTPTPIRRIARRDIATCTSARRARRMVFRKRPQDRHAIACGVCCRARGGRRVGRALHAASWSRRCASPSATSWDGGCRGGRARA